MPIRSAPSTDQTVETSVKAVRTNTAAKITAPNQSRMPFFHIFTMVLIISAQAASAGLQIMDMHYEEEEILRVIANERTELAWNSSYAQMQKRAEKAGFETASSDSVHYMVIPGYQGQNPVLIAPPPGSENTLGPIVNEYYQQSLWDWFYGTFLTTNSINSGEALQ